MKQIAKSLSIGILIVLVGLLALGCSAEDDIWADWPAGDESDYLGKADDSYTEKAEFFNPNNFYYMRIKDWRSDKMNPGALGEYTEVDGSRFYVYESDPSSYRHCPDEEVSRADRIHRAENFKMRTSGNLTKGTPKSSYKIKFTEKSDRMHKMKALNLKSMWNDVSQMREALAWRLFQIVGVHASRHVYSKFCVNSRYYGLYSVIEQVDKPFLKDHFGDNDEGNLYKAYWEDVGPADLTYKENAGDDSGAQYFSAANMDERTYRLKTNDEEDDDPAYQTYDDLAKFIKVINGIDLPGEGDEKFDTDEYKEAVENIFDVKTFLRWASLNILLGAWDNYWATPSNYYLYNSGKVGGEELFMEHPYFHFIPWDYDNTLGVTYFDVDWHNTDIVDWEAATLGYYGGRKTSKLPLIKNILKNKDFMAYYLDHMQWLLTNHFRESWFEEQIGNEGSGGIWDTIRHSVYLESDTETGFPHTGRQFTNEQVYWNGFRHEELDRGGQFILGIRHYVTMRNDTAWEDVYKWRENMNLPEGSSGVTFPELQSTIPEL
jgi:spore coat protein CotH